MAVIDLGQLPYHIAFDMIEYCARHKIDSDKCAELLHAWYAVPIPDVTWELDVPDIVATFFVLKYS